MNRMFGLATACAASLVACGGDPPPLYGDPPLSASTREMGVVPPDMAQRPFPAGPYGNQPGDTLFDLDLAGYRLDLDHTDSTMLAWEDHITLASVRSKYAKSKCMVIAVDAFW